jgi:hypothetical protein
VLKTTFAKQTERSLDHEAILPSIICIEEAEAFTGSLHMIGKIQQAPMARAKSNPIFQTRVINRFELRERECITTIVRKLITPSGIAILFRGSINNHTTPFSSHHSEVAVVSQGAIRRLAFGGRSTCKGHRIGSRQMLKAGISGVFGEDL